MWTESTARGTDRLVLLALAEHADETGLCHDLSLRSIADYVRVHRATVARSIKRLEGLREVVAVRHEIRGRGRRHRYLIVMSRDYDDLCSRVNSAPLMFTEPPPARDVPARRVFTSAHRLLHRLGLRDGWRCAYCGREVGCPCRPGLLAAVADHVFPASRGGEDADSNRCLACRPCNEQKADRTPSEWGIA